MAEQKRKNKTSETRLRVTARYHEKFDKMLIRIRKDGSDGITPEMIKEAAADKGQSVNAYIIEAIKQRMARY